MVLKGHLQINVNVPEARVLFNQKFQGTAGVGRPLNLLNLPTGKLKVHLQAEGYDVLEREVAIRQNQWTQEVFELLPRGSSKRMEAMARTMAWILALFTSWP